MKRMKYLLVALLALTVACSGGGSSTDPKDAPDCGTNCRPTFTPTPVRAAETPQSAATVPTANPWSTKAPLLAPNSEFAAAQLDGKIYVIGGYPQSRFVQNTVQVYDIASNAWQYTTPLPAPVHHTVAAGVNGK